MINENIAANDISEINSHDKIDTCKFTKKENRKVSKLVKSISDFTNDDILVYGDWQQKRLLDISNEFVKIVTSSDISKALDCIENINNPVDSMKYKYDSKTGKNVSKEFFIRNLEEYKSILKELDDEIIIYKKGLKKLKNRLKLYNKFKLENDYYIKEINIYIIAGEMWLSCMKQDNLEKQIRDLRTSRNAAIATNNQIDTLYSSDKKLCSSIKTLLKTIRSSKKLVNKLILFKPRKRKETL